MAVSIRKRKRQNDENGSGSGAEDDQAMRERFQKAFESKFKPLSPSEYPAQIVHPEATDEDDKPGDSEWDGLSDEDVAVQVVDHNTSRGEDQVDEKSERKSFMVSIFDHFYVDITKIFQSHQNHHRPQQNLLLD